MEDNQIVSLFWDRDERAIAETDLKYHSFCFGVAWNLLTNKQDSEECVNDTWFAAWRSIPPKRPLKLPAFLGKITRGFAIDMLRKKYAADYENISFDCDLDVPEIFSSLQSTQGIVKQKIYVDTSMVSELYLTDTDIVEKHTWPGSGFWMGKRNQNGRHKMMHILFMHIKRIRIYQFFMKL